MIERYTRPEMGAVWTQQAKFQSWLDVELAATDAWAAEGVVPAEAAAVCREKASFTVEEVNAREEITNHDVAAFVDDVVTVSDDEITIDVTQIGNSTAKGLKVYLIGYLG